MSTASTLKAIRLTHLYSGVFLAPAILFFAITGGLQMFGLHETSKGSSYVPPRLLMHLSQLHKKGTLYLPPPRPKAPEGAKPDAAPKADVPKPAAPVSNRPNPLPIKIFFAIVSVGLVVSMLSGLAMAWKYARRKWVPAAVLLAGIVVPLGLLLI